MFLPGSVLEDRTFLRISSSFQVIHTTDKPLAILINKRRENNQINKIRNEKGEVQTMQKYKGL